MLVLFILTSAYFTATLCISQEAEKQTPPPHTHTATATHCFLRLNNMIYRLVFGSDSSQHPADIEKKYWETVDGEDHFNAYYGSDIDTTVHGR